MRQQIIVSGMGGQGVLFVTKIIAQAAINMGIDVLTAETHGMAQRGGTVISTIKTGEFSSPLVRVQSADIGLFLHYENLKVHRNFLKPEIKPFVNTDRSGDYLSIDASEIARKHGSVVLSNLVLLGYCVKKSNLFCGVEEIEKAIRHVTKQSLADSNLDVFRKGYLYQERV